MNFRVTLGGKGKTMGNSRGGFKAFAEHLQLHFTPFCSIYLFCMSDK